MTPNIYVEQKSVNATDYYKVGDLIDARHDGSWWEGKILNITNISPTSNIKPEIPGGELSDKYLYHVQFER